MRDAAGLQSQSRRRPQGSHAPSEALPEGIHDGGSAPRREQAQAGHLSSGRSLIWAVSRKARTPPLGCCGSGLRCAPNYVFPLFGVSSKSAWPVAAVLAVSTWGCGFGFLPPSS